MVDGLSEFNTMQHNAPQLNVSDPEDEDDQDGGRLRHRFENSLEETLSELDFALMSQSGAMWDDLDLHRQSTDAHIQSDLILVGSVGAAASTFTVGYVAWALRSGFILSGLLAQMPAWYSMDPMLIMQAFSGSRTEETLEQLMERKSKAVKGSG
jgi:hypothetical protein